MPLRHKWHLEINSCLASAQSVGCIEAFVEFRSPLGFAFAKRQGKEILLRNAFQGKIGNVPESETP